MVLHFRASVLSPQRHLQEARLIAANARREIRTADMLMRGTTAVDLGTIISLVTTGVVDLAATALTIKLNVPDKTN